MNHNGTVTGYLEKKAPSGVGRSKYKRSFFTLDAKLMTLTNFDQATITVKGADRQAAPGGLVTELNIRDVVSVEYNGGRKFALQTRGKMERFRAASEDDAYVWVKAIKKLVALAIHGPSKSPDRKKPKKSKPRPKIQSPSPGVRATNLSQGEQDVYKRNVVKRKTKQGSTIQEVVPPPPPEEDFLPPPPPPPEDTPPPPPEVEEPILQNTYKRPNINRPTYKFRVHDKTLIIPSGAGKNSRATHGTLTELGTNITSMSAIGVNADTDKFQVNQRKVVRPQTRRETVTKVIQKSEKTFNLLYDTLSTSTSLANKLFRNLDDVAVQEMVQQMFLIEFRIGDEIVTQNEPTNKFFVIEEGMLEFFVKPRVKKQNKQELSFQFEDNTYSMWRDTVASTTVNKPDVNAAFTEYQQSMPAKQQGKSPSAEPYSRKKKAQASKPSYEPEIGEERSLGVRSTGVYFGELSLLYEEPSKVTIRAISEGRAWAIDRKEFHKISTEASQRQRKEKLLYLESNELFSDILNTMQLTALTEAVEYKYYSHNEVIQGIGNDIKKLLWIKKGEVAVYNELVEDCQEAAPLSTMKMGNSFGDVALLEKCLSEYHLLSKGKTVMLELDIAEAEEIIGKVRNVFKDNFLSKNSANLPSEMSLESGITQLQSAVEEMKLTLRNRMTSRITTSQVSTFRESRVSRTSILNPIDVNYVDVPPLIEDIGLHDIFPLTLLGGGCFGTVHLVRNTKDEDLTIKTNVSTTKERINLFAMKVVTRLDPEDTDTKWQEGLDNELQAWSEVSYIAGSPFVATLYHTYADVGTVYFLTEFCCGGNLYETMQKVRRHRFEDLSVKQFFMSNVLLGIEAIHSRSIIFRDLKPENILISKTGYLKVTDFGLCKKSFRTFTVCGTPDYIAPEVVLSRGHDSASDFWGLGVLLFEMSIGRPPFPGRDAMDKYEAVLAHRTGQFTGMINKRVEIYTDVTRYEERIEELRNPVALMRSDSRSSFGSDQNDLPEDVIFVRRFTWDLINRLIEPKKSKRIGVLASGFDGIKNHDFFGDFNWEAVQKMELRAPLVPYDPEEDILRELETEEFEPYEVHAEHVAPDTTNYAPKVNTIIGGLAHFAEPDGLQI